MESFLSNVFAPLEDTQVGALFWCVGSHTARWKSGVAELVGDGTGRRYSSAGAYRSIENVRQMLERGEDPQEAMVRRGRELGVHVYASIRMNDNHFNGAQIEDLAKGGKSGFTQLRIDHPEWLLGDRTSEWFALSWNLEVPEVREHRLAYVEEVCRLYEWDGVELDWMRHAFHLPQDDAYRLRYVITDMQRSVRRLADELSQKRGRPFYVAARVASSLEMCRQVGFDVPTWIQEGLVDILIPAGGAMTDASIDVGEFRSLCSGTDVVVYPGLDGGMPNETQRVAEMYRINDAIMRAIVSRYHKAQADGIYLFNWFSDRELRRELLTTIGSPETLRRKKKTYAAVRRVIVREGDWRGAYRIDRLLGEVPVRLKPTRTGDGPTITLDVADDVQADTPSRIELRLRLEQWVPGDEVRVLWNGGELPEPRVEYIPDSIPAISATSNAVWQRHELRADQITAGVDKVKAILDRRGDMMDCDIVLTDVELDVEY
jgi:hypothetical protein